MAICSLDDFKEYVGTSSTAKDSLLQACLAAAEREVLNYCKRRADWTGFEASTGTRYYKAESIVDLPVGNQYSVAGGKSWDRWAGSAWGSDTAPVLWLGDADLLSVDSLTNGDGTAISSTAYWLEPRNRKPYRYIRLKTSEQWVFNTDGEVEVAGSWGFSTGADATIKQCVKELGKYLLDSRASATWDITASPDIGVITIPKGFPAHVAKALSNGGYVRSNKVW